MELQDYVQKTYPEDTYRYITSSGMCYEVTQESKYVSQTGQPLRMKVHLIL